MRIRKISGIGAAIFMVLALSVCGSNKVASQTVDAPSAAKASADKAAAAAKIATEAKPLMGAAGHVDAPSAHKPAAIAPADGAAAQANAGEPKASEAAKVDAAIVASVWAKKCKHCHGKDGRANCKFGKMKKVADMTTAAWQKRFSDVQLRRVTINGFKQRQKDGVKQRMGPLKGQPPEVIDGLVRFMRRLKR